MTNIFKINPPGKATTCPTVSLKVFVGKMTESQSNAPSAVITNRARFG